MNGEIKWGNPFQKFNLENEKEEERITLRRILQRLVL
jgi:hypothetical protein